MKYVNLDRYIVPTIWLTIDFSVEKEKQNELEISLDQIDLISYKLKLFQNILLYFAVSPLHAIGSTLKRKRWWWLHSFHTSNSNISISLVALFTKMRFKKKRRRIMLLLLLLFASDSPLLTILLIRCLIYFMLGSSTS